MNFPRPYEVVAPLTVFEVLRGLRRPDRRKIEEFLQRLVRQPSLPGDFEAPSDDGKIHRVKIVGNWLVSYWSDDAVREIRFTNLEAIE